MSFEHLFYSPVQKDTMQNKVHTNDTWMILNNLVTEFHHQNEYIIIYFDREWNEVRCPLTTLFNYLTPGEITPYAVYSVILNMLPVLWCPHKAQILYNAQRTWEEEDSLF